MPVAGGRVVSTVDYYAGGLPFERGTPSGGRQVLYQKWISGNIDLHYICLCQMRIRLHSLALKPREDVTRSPKQGISGPIKGRVNKEFILKNCRHNATWAVQDTHRLRIFTDKLSKYDRHQSFPSLAIPFGSHCFLSIRWNTRAQCTLEVRCFLLKSTIITLIMQHTSATGFHTKDKHRMKNCLLICPQGHSRMWSVQSDPFDLYWTATNHEFHLWLDWNASLDVREC